jgi:hypothetical protein
LRRRGAGPGRSGGVGWTVKKMDFIIGGGEGERFVWGAETGFRQ